MPGINVALESLVTLYPLPGLQSPSPLTRAKAAFSFALHTYVQHILPDGQSAGPATPTVVSYLIAGCRRKVVIYTWKDGEPQEVQVCYVSCLVECTSINLYVGSPTTALPPDNDLSQ